MYEYLLRRVKIFKSMRNGLFISYAHPIVCRLVAYYENSNRQSNISWPMSLAASINARPPSSCQLK